MPEVPDLKNYIRRVSGSSGDSNDELFMSDMFDHDRTMYFVVKPGGLTVQQVIDLNNLYIERLSAIKDTFVPTEDGPQTPEDQAWNDTYLNVVLSPGYALDRLATKLKEIEMRLGDLEVVQDS